MNHYSKLIQGLTPPWQPVIIGTENSIIIKKADIKIFMVILLNFLEDASVLLISLFKKHMNHFESVLFRQTLVLLLSKRTIGL
jgi:hypothetical protein